MNVLFAPDWRSGVPYQHLLTDALAHHGVQAGFLQNYKRGLPLARLMREQQRLLPKERRWDLLHLHWPEAYFPAKGDRLDWWRVARFPLDLALATVSLPLVVTAHNLHAHNRGTERLALRASRAAFRRARIVIAHSAAAGEALAATFGIAPARIRVIPHGDLSVVLPPPVSQGEARARLGLGAGRICLMFGVVEPYKGIEEVLAYWRRAQPDATLAIAGMPHTPAYGDAIRAAAEGIPNVHRCPERLSDGELRLWLCAADCVLFNYRTIFTSGAATLARACGVPILLPARLMTLDLGEPHPSVFRFAGFDEAFPPMLEAALARGHDPAAAAEWQAATAWESVARATAAAYRDAASSASPQR